MTPFLFTVFVSGLGFSFFISLFVVLFALPGTEAWKSDAFRTKVNPGPAEHYVAGFTCLILSLFFLINLLFAICADPRAPCFAETRFRAESLREITTLFGLSEEELKKSDAAAAPVKASKSSRSPTTATTASKSSRRPTTASKASKRPNSASSTHARRHPSTANSTSTTVEIYSAVEGNLSDMVDELDALDV
jgi:hypothetical protein